MSTNTVDVQLFKKEPIVGKLEITIMYNHEINPTTPPQSSLSSSFNNDEQQQENECTTRDNVNSNFKRTFSETAKITKRRFNMREAIIIGQAAPSNVFNSDDRPNDQQSETVNDNLSNDQSSANNDNKIVLLFHDNTNDVNDDINQKAAVFDNTILAQGKELPLCMLGHIFEENNKYYLECENLSLKMQLPPNKALHTVQNIAPRIFAHTHHPPPVEFTSPLSRELIIPPTMSVEAFNADPTFHVKFCNSTYALPSFCSFWDIGGTLVYRKTKAGYPALDYRPSRPAIFKNQNTGSCFNCRYISLVMLKKPVPILILENNTISESGRKLLSSFDKKDVPVMLMYLKVAKLTAYKDPTDKETWFPSAYVQCMIIDKNDA